MMQYGILTAPAYHAREARKSQRRAQYGAAAEMQEAERKAKEEDVQNREFARQDRKKRRKAIDRNKTLITDPLGSGGKADVIKKTLLGE